jgi:hypothetical protein
MRFDLAHLRGHGHALHKTARVATQVCRLESLVLAARFPGLNANSVTRFQCRDPNWFVGAVLQVQALQIAEFAFFLTKSAKARKRYRLYCTMCPMLTKRFDMCKQKKATPAFTLVELLVVK